MSLSESQYPAPQLGAALEVHLSESDSSTLLFAGRSSALRRASRAQICWWVATMGMYAGARPAACVCCRSCVGTRRSGPLVGPIGQLRIPEHLGIQSGHLGTRTDALGQGRERSDRVSGGVGSGLRFEAFALAA